MPLALLAAFAGSLALHVAAMFGTDYELFGEETEPVALRVELQPFPAARPELTPAVKKPLAKPRPKVLASQAKAKTPEEMPAPAVESPPPAPSTAEAKASEPPAAQAEQPAQPLLPSRGVIRYAVFMGTQGFAVGRAEHRWEFTEDGRYRLHGQTETTGLVAVFKSLRFENESSGRLTAGGLAPETYRTLKNGRDGNEGADFDWSKASVHLARDGSTRGVAPGTQDILSLNYQLAYLPQPEKGASIGVVTGKKYERYALDSLGEEVLETPAGRFRTLHLRAMTDSTTEIWIALDHYRLPVKIRFTDKKGESFEQLVTEIGAIADETAR